MIKPLNNRIVIDVDKGERVTQSGLIIPGEDKLQAITGVVVVGNDRVELGQRVAVSKYGIDEVTVDGNSYLLVSDFSILGIF